MLLLRLYRQLLTIRNSLKFGSENPEIWIRDCLMSYQGNPDTGFEKPDRRVKHIAVRFFKEPGTGTSAGKVNRWFFIPGEKDMNVGEGYLLFHLKDQDGVMEMD